MQDRENRHQVAFQKGFVGGIRRQSRLGGWKEVDVGETATTSTTVECLRLSPRVASKEGLKTVVSRSSLRDLRDCLWSAFSVGKRDVMEPVKAQTITFRHEKINSHHLP